MKTRTAPRIALNLFGISFGLTGLAGMWTAAGRALHLPDIVGDAFWVIAVVVWVVTLLRYLIGARTVATIREDLRHPVLGPFAALAPIVAILFGERVHGALPLVGEIWVLAAATVSFSFGAWFIAHLASGAHEVDKLHSGYFLPTVAGALISAQSLAAIGQNTLALAAFGSGLLFWLLIGAITLNRLAFRSQTPASLVPTLAIFSAPPAVAGNAWFAINGAAAGIDGIQSVILGTFLILMAFQLFLIPLYLRTPFTLGFWALTFTSAASARYAIQLIAVSDVPASWVWQTLIALVTTGIIAAVAVASIRSVLRARRASRAPQRDS